MLGALTTHEYQPLPLPLTSDPCVLLTINMIITSLTLVLSSLTIIIPHSYHHSSLYLSDSVLICYRGVLQLDGSMCPSHE